MGIEVSLLGQVGLLVLPDIVIDKGYWHDEGDMPCDILTQDLQEFLLLITRQILFKVSHEMMEDVGVLFHGCPEPEGLHQQGLVLLVDRCQREALATRNKLSHASVMLFAVGEHKEFVPGMKVHKASQPLLSTPKLTPTLQGEDAFDEILPQDWIVQAAFLLHWDEGEMLHEGPGKHADALFFRHSLVVVDLDPLHSAAWRVTLENEPAEVFSFKFPDAVSCPVTHTVRMVDMGADGNKTGRLNVPHEAHGLPRYSQTTFSLGTHGDKFHILTQGIGDESIMSVSAVKPDMLPQEAGAYTESNPLCHGNPFQ